MTGPIPWPQIAQSAQQLGAADAAQRGRVREAERRAELAARSAAFKQALLEALNTPAPLPSAPMPVTPGARIL